MPIGIHVSKTLSGVSRNITTALTEDTSILNDLTFKQKCIQIFVAGPQTFKEILSSDEKNAVKKWVDQNRYQLIIHGAYVDNPWNNNNAGIHNIKQEMCIAEQIGAIGVVIHLSAGAFKENNLKHVLESLSRMPQKVLDSITLFLEINAAKASQFTYETPEKITKLFDKITKLNIGLRVGLCIDTAHLFSCGVALDTDKAAMQWIGDLPDIPIMIHLNDSASIIGSGVDRHESLTLGNLWKNYNKETGNLPLYKSGLFAILKWAQEKNIIVVLERHRDGVYNDLSLIYSMGCFQ